MTSSLGILKQVDLRQVWKHEALDFTQWLALPENIDLLSEELDIEISPIETEYNVGRFSVDIFAEEVGSERKIIIENQLEKTDHDHLGKVITYASGLDAEIIIWIVKNALDEHKQAIDWLNENTGEKISFFIIRMELWQIDNSPPAPKFHIVSQPNYWSKSVKQASQNKTFSELKMLQKEFWESFIEYVLSNNYNLRTRKAHPHHWLDISFGRSDCHIGLTINTQRNEIACEVYIPDSKETYKNFKESKDKIEVELGKLEWMELPEKKASRVKKTTNADINKKEKWEDYIHWLTQNAINFQETFNKY